MRDSYLEKRPLTKRTPSTITDRKKLDEAFEEIRRPRSATYIEEFAEGVGCMAAPTHDGSVACALSLSAPTSRFTSEWPRYLEIAQRIVSSRL